MPGLPAADGRIAVMTIPGLPEMPPRLPVTDDLRAIIHSCDFAVDYELLHEPAPARSPGGSPLPETGAEQSHRITETAIMYAVENGLLTVPEDIAERLDGYFPVQRAPAERSRP